ncbi:hypothetical protein LguiB_000061 [Lonicera macranthoides]
MTYALFPAFNFNETCTGYDNLKGYEQDEVVAKIKQVPTCEMENSVGIDSFCTDYGVYLQNVSKKNVCLFEDENQPISDYWMQNNFQLNGTPSHAVQSIYGATKSLEKPCGFSVESLELLSKYGRGFEKPKDGNQSKLSSNCSITGTQKLSTEDIIRLAGERYIDFSTHMANGYSMFIHPYGSSLSSLSTEETRDVELAHLLLAAAEKVGYKQFDFASRLLTYCEGMASDSGNPVRRVVFYFAEALRERIIRETGSKAIKGVNEEQLRCKSGIASDANLAFLACHQELPFPQVLQFAGMQAIIDNIRMATKVHCIDLEIRSGVHWTAVMQALAERDNYRVELFRITALGTTDRRKIEGTGKRLRSFAESLKLPFIFQIVFLSDMIDLKEELFKIEADEAVAIYSPMILRSMISRPDCLENVMRVMRRLRPEIVVVAEIEASHNSPSFVSRFIEVLFHYSTLFDCLEDCMDRDNQFRRAIEGIHSREEIQNMVATEGEERVARSVKIKVWRAFFKRFRMVEIELSESSWYQANLVLKQFTCGSSCTLDTNENCLIVGWKGTPIHSLSAWKFR